MCVVQLRELLLQIPNVVFCLRHVGAQFNGFLLSAEMRAAQKRQELNAKDGQLVETKTREEVD
jgi:hypothetical protein